MKKKSPICDNFNMKSKHFIKINKIIESCKTIEHIYQADNCIDTLDSIFDVKLSNLGYLRTKLHKKLSLISK